MAELYSVEERLRILEGKVKLLEKVHPDLAAEMKKVDKLINTVGHLRQNLESMVIATEARINRRLDYAAAIGKRDREGLNLFIAQCSTKLEWDEFKKKFYSELKERIKEFTAKEPTDGLGD